MSKFEVLITEILTKSVIVDAEDKDEALLKVSDKWQDGEIELDVSNFCDVEFEVRPFEKINGKLTIDYDKPVPRYNRNSLAFPPTAWRLENFEEDIERMKREGYLRNV